MADFSELTQLAADLTSAPAKANRNVQKAVEVTARNVKDDWRQGAMVSAERGNVASAYPYSIDYDMEVGSGEIAAEIGPNLGRKGGSAGFLEEAKGRVRSAPQHAGRDAVRANESDFVRGLQIAVFDATAEAVEK